MKNVPLDVAAYTLHGEVVVTRFDDIRQARQTDDAIFVSLHGQSRTIEKVE